MVMGDENQGIIYVAVLIFPKYVVGRRFRGYLNILST